MDLANIFRTLYDTPIEVPEVKMVRKILAEQDVEVLATKDDDAVQRRVYMRELERKAMDTLGRRVKINQTSKKKMLKAILLKLTKSSILPISLLKFTLLIQVLVHLGSINHLMVRMIMVGVARTSRLLMILGKIILKISSLQTISVLQLVKVTLNSTLQVFMKVPKKKLFLQDSLQRLAKANLQTSIVKIT
jgi:hypothetical protein